MALKLPAYLTGFSSKSDGSAGIRFSTNELSAEDFSVLKNHLNEFGWLLFSENNIKAADIPKEEIHEDESKSPSKRQRAVLFLIWKRLGEPSGNFENYYRGRMEKNIEKLKSELE